MLYELFWLFHFTFNIYLIPNLSMTTTFVKTAWFLCFFFTLLKNSFQILFSWSSNIIEDQNYGRVYKPRTIVLENSKRQLGNILEDICSDLTKICYTISDSIDTDRYSGSSHIFVLIFIGKLVWSIMINSDFLILLS